ncbi:MAG: hypothetical protein ABS99_10355 [Acetobacteraceae bacterium SCN 69-10]|nr:DUF1127 domain-containing protein [Rhodospirillales bacterium]ODU53903.1 MAG: hypothetical protein ABS99_10355 [Acetobacteraceae bacterium SCN 69-10]OJY64157.1 MAG: hypothetical protein BGP12_16665 [Rhodospirillales bacterium 70-18]
MATLTHDTPTALGHSLASPHGLVARLQAWLAARRDYAEAMRALSQVDDRDLRDLGISPYDFEAIARGDFRR